MEMDSVTYDDLAEDGEENMSFAGTLMGKNAKKAKPVKKPKYFSIKGNIAYKRPTWQSSTAHGMLIEKIRSKTIMPNTASQRQQRTFHS